MEHNDMINKTHSKEDIEQEIRNIIEQNYSIAKELRNIMYYDEF